MSSSQSCLTDYGVAESTSADTKQDQPKPDTAIPGHTPKIGFENPEQHAVGPEIREQREVDWVVYTGRYPHVLDAVRLGFGIGHREDMSYQWSPSEIGLPVHFLDNDYRNADLDRFVDRVFEVEPEIAVLGDLYEQDALVTHLGAANEIWGSYPDMELILAPKCEAVFDKIPSEFVLGYPNGASDIQAPDVVPRREWRTTDHRLHILGGSPLETLEEITKLTTDWVTGEPPAAIAGVDYNGYKQFAEQWGDYASAYGGWEQNLRDAYLPKRDLLLYSLLNAKHFWVANGVWPNTRVPDLPSRDELLAVQQADIRLGDLTDDEKVVAETPPITSRRTENPLFRTDETIAEIIEPVSPINQLFSRSSWNPAGVLSQSADLNLPKRQTFESVCPGCGAHVFAGQSRHQESGDKGNGEAVLVSYEGVGVDEQNHADSIGTADIDRLRMDRQFSSTYLFCSENCRERTEGRSGRLLKRDDANGVFADGDEIARLVHP
jgi:hypothetical protein